LAGAYAFAPYLSAAVS